jgi:hypothetical protein
VLLTSAAGLLAALWMALLVSRFLFGQVAVAAKLNATL